MTTSARFNMSDTPPTILSNAFAKLKRVAEDWPHAWLALHCNRVVCFASPQLCRGCCSAKHRLLHELDPGHTSDKPWHWRWQRHSCSLVKAVYDSTWSISMDQNWCYANQQVSQQLSRDFAQTHNGLAVLGLTEPLFRSLQTELLRAPS